MSTPELNSFKQCEMQERVFPGMDAAVFFLPTGETPRPEIQRVIDEAGQGRWYPVNGGHYAKIPWHRAEGAERFFTRETLGWDHEHCDFCNASVSIGEKCWTADDGTGQGFVVFCNKCAEQVPT